MKQNEQYAVLMMNTHSLELFHVLIPRTRFSHILQDLSDSYIVVKVEVLSNVKTYVELMAEIRENNRPEDLNYGKKIKE